MLLGREDRVISGAGRRMRQISLHKKNIVESFNAFCKLLHVASLDNIILYYFSSRGYCLIEVFKSDALIFLFGQLVLPMNPKQQLFDVLHSGECDRVITILRVFGRVEPGRHLNIKLVCYLLPERIRPR